MLQGVKLSSAQCPTTAEDIEEMSVIPYASAIGYIMYAMLCTRPDVCLAISLAGRYQCNPKVVKGHAVPPCVVLVIDDILFGLMVALSYI